MFAGLCLTAGSALADVRGVWLVQSGNAHVKIDDCGDKLCGSIVWLKEPLDENGKEKLDKENEDEALRTRKIMGLPMLKDFVADGENAWDDGSIYNAEDGKTYSSEMQLKDANTLEVKGCVLFFCKSQTWTRVH